MSAWFVLVLAAVLGALASTVWVGVCRARRAGLGLDVSGGSHRASGGVRSCGGGCSASSSGCVSGCGPVGAATQVHWQGPGRGH
jgi:hypothetical protein